MYSKKFVLCLSLITHSFLMADDLDVDSLLSHIEKKSDLSEKTKLENGGISYIYTREDLIKMQAHNLKDVLKSTYPFGYAENRYGYSDPLTNGTNAPFLSSSIRIYVDDQEISTGLYGSGLSLYGNINIDFVDHIEVYSGNPTFEYSTENTFILIKLYTKSATRDAGTKVSLSGGSYGTKGLSAYNSDELDNDWSYFAFVSGVDKKSQPHDNDGASLSRDSQTANIVGTLTKGEQKILITNMVQNRDGFLGYSVSGTPKTTKHKNRFLHIGYNTKMDDLSLLATYNRTYQSSSFEDLYRDKLKKTHQYSLDSTTTSNVYTAGLNYKMRFTSDKFLVGAKYRYKWYKYTHVEFNGASRTPSKSSNQAISTLFMENQYSISKSTILTTGANYQRVTNSDSVQNDNLYSYRLGLTYTDENLISKSIVSYMELSLDPYLVHNTLFLADPTNKVPKTKQNIFMQDLKYKQGSHQYEMIVSYTTSHHQLLPDRATGLLAANSQDIKITSALSRYTKEYNQFDKFEATLSATKIENIPSLRILKRYAVNMRNFNTFGKYNIFNELLFYKDNETYKNRFDYTLGAIYNYSDNLSVSLKGTNLFNNAKKTGYHVVDIQTLQPKTLFISPIDRTVMARVEYTF